MKRYTSLKRSTKPIRQCSTKRAEQLREYAIKRAAFLLENKWCQVWLAEHDVTQAEVDELGFVEVRVKSDPAGVGRHFLKCPPSQEIHHVRGRIGTMLNDERYWLALGRVSHEWIHQHPSWARSKGYLK